MQYKIPSEISNGIECMKENVTCPDEISNGRAITPETIARDRYTFLAFSFSLRCSLASRFFVSASSFFFRAASCFASLASSFSFLWRSFLAFSSSFAFFAASATSFCFFAIFRSGDALGFACVFFGVVSSSSSSSSARCICS